MDGMVHNIHLANRGCNLRPECVDNRVEVVEGVNLQRRLWLIEQRDYARSGRESRRHNFYRAAPLGNAYTRIHTHTHTLGRKGDAYTQHTEAKWEAA